MTGFLSSQLITSKSNPQFRRWLDLLNTQGIREHGLYLLSGEKLVHEMIQQRPQEIVSVLVPEKQPTSLDLRDFKIFELSHELFSPLDELGTKKPMAVCKLPIIENEDLKTEPVEKVVVSALQDPSNVGALVRASLAFGVQRLILLKESAFPFLPKSVKASSGTVTQMKFSRGPSIHEISSDPAMQKGLLVLDQEGQSISDFQWPKTFRLLIGEEGRGLPLGLRSSSALRIPISNDVESLNAVTAASVALFLANQKS